MAILLIFAFISGVITIFAPCIWPLLPLILSTTVTGGHRKPFGVVLGIILSFGALTLGLSYLLKVFPFDPNALRYFSVFVIAFLGLTLLIPKLSRLVEGYVSRFSGVFATRFVGKNTNGFLGGFLTGLTLGIVWTPCAGPILATIATLAVTNSLNIGIVLVTVAYLFGISIPLFLFALFGRHIFTKSRALSKYTGTIQRVFGVIMILTAILIFTGLDKKLQANLLNYFPAFDQSLAKFESNSAIKDQLNSLRGNNSSSNVQTGDSLLPENYPAPEFRGISNWLNSPPLKMSELRGKVVLVDFWTYTCINCIRTLPYIVEWDKKYRDKGLVIVGVHTPEFEFEKNTKNVENALKQYDIEYPVAQDNDFDTWNAFNNQYWPAKYLIDSTGNVRYTHFGEGEYDVTEKAIQKLLEEAGNTVDEEIGTSTYAPNSQISPETYIGSARMQYFYPKGSLPAVQNKFDLQTNFPVNSFSLGGTWNIMPEYSNSVDKSVLSYNFRAQKVFLVMRSSDGKPKKVKVLLDNQNPGVNAGKDVKNGVVTVDSDRLYELINLPGVENKKLRLEFENGVEVFAFTFG